MCFLFTLLIATLNFALVSLRNLLAATAANPPVEVAPAAIIAKVAKQAGHISSSFARIFHFG
jgi:hypothetical protein